MEKSASLYDRVRALRNAANEKLESLKSDSIYENINTATEGDLSTTEYYLPSADLLSDYARSKAAHKSADDVSQSQTGRYQTGECCSSPPSSLSPSPLSLSLRLSLSPLSSPPLSLPSPLSPLLSLLVLV